jgi:hypothetical protein
MSTVLVLQLGKHATGLSAFMEMPHALSDHPIQYSCRQSMINATVDVTERLPILKIGGAWTFPGTRGKLCAH